MPAFTTTMTLPKVLQTLEVDIKWLANETGLSYDVVRRAVMGGKKKTHVTSAQAIATALGMELYEIDWPCGLTNKGRHAYTGGTYTVGTKQLEANFCGSCGLQLPLSNQCVCA